MKPDTNPPVQLVLVAAEIGRDADELAVQLGDAVILDVAAIRCVAVAVARDLITTHRRRLKDEHDRAAARWAAAEARPNALRDRVQALARQQKRFDGADVSALAVMM